MLARMWRKQKTPPLLLELQVLNQLWKSENWKLYYHRLTQYLSWAYIQKLFQLVRHMLHYVHSSLIYNSQKLERTQMSLNRGMDTENVVHLHNGVLLSYLKK